MFDKNLLDIHKSVVHYFITKPEQGQMKVIFCGLRKASVLDITVSAQEDYQEGVGGGSPVLVLFIGTAAVVTQLVYND